MRALLANAVERATVTSVNGSLNYPASSIYDEFLRRKFKSLFDTDTLTIDLVETSDVNSFYIGFHNIATGTVTFFDETLTPVGDVLDLAGILDIHVAYFDTITVRRIVVDMATVDADTKLFVGEIGAGIYTQFPDVILAGYDFAIQDGTTIQSSQGGQTSRNKGSSLRSRDFTWPALTKAQFDAINTPVLSHGIGKTAFWDLFEDNRDFDPPMWAFVAKPREATQTNENQFNVKLSLQEAQ